VAGVGWWMVWGWLEWEWEGGTVGLGGGVDILVVGLRLCVAVVEGG
jgi:hypothetical protein